VSVNPNPVLAPIRVAIVASDPARRSALANLVAAGGHAIAEDSAQADVVLTDDASRAFAHQRVIVLGDSFAGDAAGVLPSDASAEQIDAAIRAVQAGLWVRARDESASDSEPLLTPREIEVLEALTRGLSNKAIARALAISEHTVKFHVESLFRKLEVNSRAQAAVRGLALLARNRIEV